MTSVFVVGTFVVFATVFERSALNADYDQSTVWLLVCAKQRRYQLRNVHFE